MGHRIELYDGQHPSQPPCETAYAETEREARRIAARLLGHASLRGAATWMHGPSGVAYQFGPRGEMDNGYDWVAIVDDNDDGDGRRLPLALGPRAGWRAARRGAAPGGGATSLNRHTPTGRVAGLILEQRFSRCSGDRTDCAPLTFGACPWSSGRWQKPGGTPGNKRKNTL